MLLRALASLSAIVLASATCRNENSETATKIECAKKQSDSVVPRHVRVWYEKGGFGGWPANNGIWIWGNEILVGFVKAEHLDTVGHNYKRSSAQNMYARSLDGGETWTIENAYDHGQRHSAFDNVANAKQVQPKKLKVALDFLHPEFALAFVRVTNDVGPTYFYYSYNKGKSWQGPFQFPQYKPGTANRTDYIINGSRSLMDFVSVGVGRVGVFQTKDGALSWKLLSWIGPDRTDTLRQGFLTMPSSVRLSKNEILTVIRQREDSKQNLLSSYLSKDNGNTWIKLKDPVSNTGGGGSPPALVKLEDGRLCLAYAFRSNKGSKMLVKFSRDNGITWGEENVLRNDGANWDIGYPRMVQRPDGKLVVVYYWNHALSEKESRYRYIAATIFDPATMK